jgi:hypothetical protein
MASPLNKFSATKLRAALQALDAPGGPGHLSPGLPQNGA